MKFLSFVALMLISSVSNAWWGGYGGYGFGGYGYGGYGYGMPYGMMGYGYIPSPSFNYSTVIQQSPPIIINNNDPSYPQQQPQYQPRYQQQPCQYNCR